MATTWVIVADHQRARLFELESPKENMREFSDLVHPESRMHERDMAQDAPGKTSNRFGQGVHDMEKHNSPKQQEAIRFAKEVAQRLEQGRTDHEFDKLVIVADPDFLGLLRSAIPRELRAMVTQEVTKNLTHVPRAEDIRSHLPEHLQEKRINH